MQGTFAVLYVVLGMLIGAVFRDRAVYRTAPGQPPQPPPADPRRDPNWCHAHNQMQPCDGCRRPEPK